MKKLLLSLAIVIIFSAVGLIGQTPKANDKEIAIGVKTEFLVPDANLNLKFPNSKWSLTESKSGEYTFKREAVTDSKGRENIPSIVIYVGNAEQYDQELTMFVSSKQQPRLKNGMKIDNTLTRGTPNYPLSCKNSIIYKCSYSDKDIEHNQFMIYIINQNDKGIQIYMDLAKDLAPEYLQEFLTIIQSIKDQK